MGTRDLRQGEARRCGDCSPEGVLSGWLLMACIALTGLAGCRPQATQKEQRREAQSALNSPSERDRRVEKVAKPEPLATCELLDPPEIDIYPFVDGHVVFHSTLGEATLEGKPEIIDGAPEDHHEYWMARQNVAPDSLPERLRGIQGSSVFPLRPNSLGNQCSLTAGKVVALAWADEQGNGWDMDDWAKNAQRAFQQGVSFLAAPLVGECGDYLSGPGSLSTAVKSYQKWKTERVDEKTELRTKVQSQMLTEPEVKRRQREYEASLDASDDWTVGPWWKSEGSYLDMTLATTEEGGRIVLVEVAARLKKGGKSGDLAAWAGVYCLTEGDQLVSLGPDQLPLQHQAAVSHYRRTLNVIGPFGSLPLILYKYFALTPHEGRYRFEYGGPEPPPLLQ